MKYIIVSDIHVGVKRSHSKYLDIAKTLFTDIVEYAKANDIHKLIIPGDFFEVRKHIHIRALQTALVIGRMLEYFDDVYMVIGNHDMHLTTQLHPTSLSLFDQFDYIHIIDQPHQIDNITLYPWLFEKQHLLDNDYNSDIVIGHFEMNGITLNSCGTVSQDYNLKQSDFKDYKLVLSGHFHTPGQYGNITYLGSPYQTTFNDMGDEKGIYVLDSDDITLDKIPFDKYPHHYKINDTEIDSFSSITDNIIKLVFTDDYGIEENKRIMDSIKEYEPYRLIVDHYRHDSEVEDEVDDSLLNDKLAIIKSYYKNTTLPNNINYGILDKVITKIYTEITDD